MGDTYMPNGPSDDAKWAAICRNVKACYERIALALPGIRTKVINSILMTPEHAVIPSEDSVKDDAQLEQLASWYRDDASPLSPIIWFINASPPSAALTARLLARGISTNWEAHWMWANLSDVGGNSHSYAAAQPGVAVDIHVLDRDESLPPGEQKTSEQDAAVTEHLAQAVPRRVWHIVGLLDGKRVAGCFVNLTTGEDGVAGLFDMYVDENLQRKGIGAALLRESFRLAKGFGCNHMFVNSTPAGEALYLHGGFVSMRRSTTWHIRPGFHKSTPPSEAQVQFLEAIGLANLSVLDGLASRLTAADLQGKTINGMSPLAIAVHLKQQGSASWLLRHGVLPDILSLWDLGWKDKARQLILDHPEQVNSRGGDQNETPLHAAVARNDIELAKLLLASPSIDLDATDDVFESTARGWAEHMGRNDILALF